MSRPLRDHLGTNRSCREGGPCAYLAQPYSVTLVPLGFHCPFVGLSVFHKTETGDLNLFYKAVFTEPGGAVGPWINVKLHAATSTDV